MVNVKGCFLTGFTFLLRDIAPIPMALPPSSRRALKSPKLNASVSVHMHVSLGRMPRGSIEF